MTSQTRRAGSAPAALPDPLTLGIFLAFIIVSGGASIAIRFTYAELPPFWGATGRFVVAASVFWVLALIMKIEIPRGRGLLGAAIFGALGVGGAFILIYWGLVRTPASLYQILMALVPLLTLFFAYFHGLEALTGRGIAGALLAVVGIAVAVGTSTGADLSLPHIIGIIVAAGFMAEAGVVAKQFPRNHPVATNAVAMTVGALMLAVASRVAGEQWVIPTQASTWAAFAYIVIAVTVVGFLVWLWVLGRWTASGTSYAFVIIPLVTIVLAALLAGEVITVFFIIGAALVVGGVAVAVLLPQRKTGEIDVDELDWDSIDLSSCANTPLPLPLPRQADAEAA